MAVWDPGVSFREEFLPDQPDRDEHWRVVMDVPAMGRSIIVTKASSRDGAWELFDRYRRVHDRKVLRPEDV